MDREKEELFEAVSAAILRATDRPVTPEAVASLREPLERIYREAWDDGYGAGANAAS